MFTGIVETTGTIISVVKLGSNAQFQVKSPISNQLKVDQSVSHEGVCLTVENVSGNIHTVTAIHETLQKTNLGHWVTGTEINLERCLTFNGRIDGHIVQGHVDTTASCIDIIENNGSWIYRFRFPASFAELVIEKGSVSVNGTSLTVFNVSNDTFDVAIIPYTYHHTTIHKLKVGSSANIEFDIIGKYIQRRHQLKLDSDHSTSNPF